MGQDARFWRNVTIIAVAHIAILLMLARWNAEARRPNLQSIVWLNSASTESVRKQLKAGSDGAPFKEPPGSELEQPNTAPDGMPAQSDIYLPPPAPPLPTSATTPFSKPSPRVMPKVVLKAPKKPVVAKATPKPSPKKKMTPADEEKGSDQERETAKTAPFDPNVVNGDRSSSAGPDVAARASEFSWYGKMLHDRFYSEWNQPTTSAPIGAKMSALVRVRIERDGRVSNFAIVRPSGNVVVDESVAAIAKRVTQVDPLPPGLGGAFYEVNINFELSPNP